MSSTTYKLSNLGVETEALYLNIKKALQVSDSARQVEALRDALLNTAKIAGGMAEFIKTDTKF